MLSQSPRAETLRLGLAWEVMLSNAVLSSIGMEAGSRVTVFDLISAEGAGAGAAIETARQVARVTVTVFRKCMVMYDGSRLVSSGIR